jgi:hypothetical protein
MFGHHIRTGLLATVLCGCTAAGGIVNEPPPAAPGAPVANVRVYRDVSSGDVFHDLTFTINDQDTYRFGTTEDFSFELAAGSYVLGYTDGMRRCSVPVDIVGGGNYVFKLGPDCDIELEDQ